MWFTRNKAALPHEKLTLSLVVSQKKKNNNNDKLLIPCSEKQLWIFFVFRPREVVYARLYFEYYIFDSNNSNMYIHSYHQ